MTYYKALHIIEVPSVFSGGPYVLPIVTEGNYLSTVTSQLTNFFFLNSVYPSFFLITDLIIIRRLIRILNPDALTQILSCGLILEAGHFYGGVSQVQH